MPTKIEKTMPARMSIAVALTLTLALTACGGNDTTTPTPVPYTVSGTVTDSLGNPMEGVTISLSGGWSDRTTDANGEWSAEVSGEITVAPSQEGWTFAPEAERLDASASGVDFTMTLAEELERELAFVRDGDIHLLHPDGSSTPLTADDGGLDSAPDWSPDRSRIAFISSRNGTSRSTHVMQADGSGIVDVGEQFDGAPDWSPDGSQIVLSESQGGNPDIAVMNADGTGRQTLNTTAAGEADPVWSPDGSRIAFVTYVDAPGQYDVHVMDADGTNVERITADAEYEIDLDWSWTTDRIAYGADGRVRTVGPDGSDLETRVGEDAASPAWSPSGSAMVFTDYGGSQRELFLMNSDGTEVRQLTFGGGEDADW